jgi:hypothetical protein
MSAVLRREATPIEEGGAIDELFVLSDPIVGAREERET